MAALLRAKGSFELVGLKLIAKKQTKLSILSAIEIIQLRVFLGILRIGSCWKVMLAY